MNPRFTMLVSLVALTACSHEVDARVDTKAAPAQTAAPDGPQLQIGAMEHVNFAGGTELHRWDVHGTLQGELKATLRRFHAGEETVLGVAMFAAADLAIDGALLLLVHEGASVGDQGERFAEVQLAVERSNALAPERHVATSSAAPAGPMRVLPGSDNAHGWAGGTTLTCAKDRHVVLELWTERPAAKGSSSRPFFSPQALQQESRDGNDIVALTLEVNVDAPSVPRPAR